MRTGRTAATAMPLATAPSLPARLFCQPSADSAGVSPQSSSSANNCAFALPVIHRRHDADDDRTEVSSLSSATPYPAARPCSFKSWLPSRQASARFDSAGIQAAGPDGAAASEAQSIKAVDLIVKEMREMSIAERERVYEDVHGVSRNEESPQLLRSKMAQMRAELARIRYKPAYDMAVMHSPDYVNDAAFQAKFIRADNFDHVKAAHRMVKFFEFKLDIFGADKLCSTITINDLPSDAQTTVKSGRMQVLPRRDTAGRAVYCDMLAAHARLFKSVESMLQAGFYVFSTLIDDEETQRTGCVCLHFAHNWTIDLSPEQSTLFRKMSTLTYSFPIKFQAFHFLTDKNSFLMKQFINQIQLSVAKEVRHRFRRHIGSQQECFYSLMGYGMPIPVIPITEKGGIRQVNHQKWVEYRMKKERALNGQIISSGSVVAEAAKSNAGVTLTLNRPKSIQTSNDSDTDTTVSTLASTATATALTPVIDLPSRYDVLLGRGRGSQDHSGNRYLRDLVREHYDLYDKATKIEKTTIAEYIVKLVTEKGGEFLKRNEDEFWIKAGFIEARKKVSHTFRKKREMDLQSVVGKQQQRSSDAKRLCVESRTRQFE